jgi:hypothetical protein
MAYLTGALLQHDERSELLNWKAVGKIVTIRLRTSWVIVAIGALPKAVSSPRQ